MLFNSSIAIHYILFQCYKYGLNTLSCSQIGKEQNHVATQFDEVNVEIHPLDLMYSIHDKPPWHLSFILGLQV